MFRKDVYTYYSFDVPVRAGSVLAIYGNNVTCSDIQVNFTPTVITSGYVLEV